MEIVIDIPKEQYEDICHNYVNYKNTVADRLLSAIAEGTVLPEKHGRLIDACAVCQNTKDTECDTCFHNDICNVYHTPTVLKASSKGEK